MAHLWLRGTGIAPFPDERHRASSVPVRWVVDSGLRPVVTALIDGVEVAMLVHANAGFLAMLTHDALRRVTGRRVEKETAFGLGPDLRLSASGRGRARIASLAVGGCRLSDVGIEVFDLPTTNWEGMLGVDWLAASGAVLDAGRSVLEFPGGVGSPEGPPSGATSTPESAIPLQRDASTRRFLCDVNVGHGSRTAGRFVVSTVAETTLDIEYARAHGIELGEPIDDEHGPAGAVVGVWRTAAPVALRSGTVELASLRPVVYDVYAYGNTARPALGDAIAGYLGADLLVARRAVVDFGAS